jgi:hypothetical protein
MVELYKITTAQSGIANDAPTTRKVAVVQRGEGTEEGVRIAGEILDIAASDISLENSLNRQRMDRFRAEFSAKLLKLLREQDFEYGVDTPADELVRKSFSENISIAKEWLNQLFVENYDDQTVLMGILRVLSHFEYQEVAPQGPTMALAALSNVSAEVRECGIRAFENWSTLESLEVLKNVKCEEEWLNDYLQQVIAELKEELEKHVIVG